MLIPTEKKPDQPDATALRANKLLAALPDAELRHLLPSLQVLDFMFDECVYDVGARIDHVFFPIEGVVSSLALMEDGSATEVVMVGPEGLTGISALLGRCDSKHWTGFSVPGSAVKLDVRVLNDLFLQSSAAQRVMIGAYHALMTQISQRSVCNARHSLIERLCCWLLMLHDRIGGSDLRLTQEAIASRLGARRAGISDAAATLRSMKAIIYQRGTVQIANRRVLENVACECYLTLRTDWLASQ